MLESVTYDQFARGAARLAARLARLQQQQGPDDPSTQGAGGEARPPQPPPTTTTETPTPASLSPLLRWRWLERRAPVTGEPVGVLELERWVPAAEAGRPPAAVSSDEAEGAGDVQWGEFGAATKDEATVVAGGANGARAGADAKQQQQQQVQHHHYYVFHVAYSRTYRAPVLCFAATRADGSPLEPEQVRRDLSPWLQEHAPPPPQTESDRGGGGGGGGAPDPSSSSWAFYLSRGEHPGGLPGAPAQVYFLHPCRTAERMALMMAKAAVAKGQGQDGAATAAPAVASAASSSAVASGDDADAASRYLAAWLSAVAPAVGLPRPPQPEETR